MANNARKHDDKFSTNWGGPFCVLEDIGKCAYRLERLFGEHILNTWNVSHLKFHLS